MGKRIIDHWCLYYVWIVRFFERKKFKGAEEIADRMVMVPILLYLMFYIIVPIVVVLIKKAATNRDNLLASISILIFVGLGFIIFANYKHIKSRVQILTNIEDWYESVYYKRGRSIVRFHLIFTVISIPISGGLGYFILKC